MKSISFFFVVFSFLMMPPPLHQSNAYPQEKKEVPSDVKNGMELSCQLDLETVGIDDYVELTATLRNVSPLPVALYRLGWDKSTSFILSITNEKGESLNFDQDTDPWAKTLKPKHLTEDRSQNFYPKDHFIILQPGHSVLYTRVMKFNVYPILPPGTYFVSVKYRSPVPDGVAIDGITTWTEKKGFLESKPIRLQISGKSSF